MDKEYLERHNLTKAQKQFMRLAEGYLSTSMMQEADDDQNQPEQGGGMGQMGGPDDIQGMPPMDDPNADAPGQGFPSMNDANGGNMGQGGPGMENPGNDQGMPPMDDPNAGIPPIGDGQLGPIDAPGDDLESQEDDEVLDVDDLTKAQEKLFSKEKMIGHDLGKLDNRIESLLTAVEKMKGIIDHNNNEISSLKAELQKRIPTQTERLNLRGLDTYPFNVSPQDYWKKKNLDGNYEARFDNQQPTQKEYVITHKDVDDYNSTEIEKSFNKDLNQTMEKIFKGF